MEKVEKKFEVVDDDKFRNALKTVYDMAEQLMDECNCYQDWPEAYDALRVLQPYVYPEGDNFIWDD